MALTRRCCAIYSTLIVTLILWLRMKSDKIQKPPPYVPALDPPKLKSSVEIRYAQAEPLLFFLFFSTHGTRETLVEANVVRQRRSEVWPNHILVRPHRTLQSSPALLILIVSEGGAWE